MRKEYDLTTLKIKRRGVLPGLQGQSSPEAKVKITVALDDDLVAYFGSPSKPMEVLKFNGQSFLNLTGLGNLGGFKFPKPVRFRKL